MYYLNFYNVAENQLVIMILNFTGHHKEMCVADQRSLCYVERVCRGRSIDNRLLCSKSHQLQTSVNTPELCHHSADNSCRPAACVVFTDRHQIGWHFEIFNAPDTGAH